MSNVLDKNYPEISFKTDAEDLKVMINFINEFASGIVDIQDIERKKSIILLKEVRDKMEMKELQKRGTNKQFLMKFKAYHLHALLVCFMFNDRINSKRIFEKNCIDAYKNQFHQKLLAL
ncbi:MULTISPECIES: hypothetical protein [Chryseobacterium]|uniref:Uncharacterized protein n=1 Tax=Candidatus Chryseobacterium massiliense TaxID=204089 RepID=A0A3D9B2I9_9FLAO|nr:MULTISPECIES: hypothetical protein [Chryseobacterium]REC47854.1 hypothetical protein DRF68_12495 [Candidatus Chryseobacterium massiliae]